MPLQSPPHGMGAMIPAFNRATRLAKALFGCLDSSVVLIENQRAWRSRTIDNLPDRDRAAERVIASGKPIWIEDAINDPDIVEGSAGFSSINFRFYAAAPIVLADGLIAGVICAVDGEPRPYDERLMARLNDLATGLADDCEYARLMKQAEDSRAEAEQSRAEAEAANQTLSSLVKHIPTAIVMTDRDMVVVQANSRWAGSVGMTVDDVVGKSLYDVASYTRAYAALHAEVLAGKRETMPRARFEIGGKTFWLRIEFIPWRRPDGQVGGMMVASSDITELVEAMEQVEQSRAAAEVSAKILAAFVDTVPSPIVMTDRDMRIISVSKRWAHFFNTTPEEAVGKTIYEIAPEVMEPRRAEHQRTLAGERIVEHRRRTEFAGKVEWVDNERRPWRDENGEIGGILITSHSVTEMVEAMEQVARNEQRLQMAIELADLHVWEVDYVRGTLDKMGAADTFFDVPLTYADVVGDPLCAIHPDDRERSLASLARREAGGNHAPLIIRTNRADGKVVWAASAAKAFHDENGNPTRTVGLFQNVTSIKEAENSLIEARDAAEQANRSKSEFLANMSHEIRTPLNGVLGMAQVIEADELSDVQRERIKVVRESGAALLAILNDVLDLSKIQAGKLELEITDFDIGELAPVVIAAFDGVAAAKDVKLSVEIDQTATGAWKGDILRLRQVVSNLVSNALKFTSEGEVSLRVTHDGEAMTLAIRDTGIGIDPEKIPGLFEKFSQEDASTTRRYGGTGLGLSICRELVDLMGGRIEVESAKGEGSCFSVVVPLERGVAIARPAAKASRPAPAEDAAAGAPLRILAAEDNATNQLVLRSLLAPLGADLTLASNGREAVAAFKASQFDVVLMDVQMPEMNGVEATGIIRAWEKEQGRVRTPILSLTANVMLYQLDEYRAAGMDGAIAKPIEVEKLYAALDEALTAAEEARAAA